MDYTIPLNVERQRYLSDSECSDCTIPDHVNNKSLLINSFTKDAQCLKEIRKLMEESGDELLIKNTWEFTDDWLLRYIRSRTYNVESAFERMQNHMYVRRVKNPEIFAKLYPSTVYRAIETGMAGILKQRDSKGRHVLFFRVGLWDPDDIPVDEMLLSLMILGWEMLSFKETQLQGIVIVLDAKGFSVKHAKTGTPMNIQKYADLILRASPFKCKGGHILFAPRMFNLTLAVVKMFLPHKLRKRIHVHGSSTSGLHEFVSPSILPTWLGGTLSDEEAIDSDIINALYTKEKEDYYKSFCC